jgi:hypothetical protein
MVEDKINLPVTEKSRLIINFEKQSNWQIELDEILVEKNIEKIRDQLTELTMNSIQERFCGFLEDSYQIHIFLETLNKYINSKNNTWKKDELKLKKTYKNRKAILELVRHDYTYELNIFKKEVNFFDNGNKILTYKSEWVKNNIADEHSICLYALNWVEKNCSEYFEKGYPIRKI